MATQIKTTATKSIPTLSEPPLIGSLVVYKKDPFEFKRRILRNFGDIAKFHYGPLPFIMITAPELVHNILVEHPYEFNRGIAIYNAFRPIMGNSMFISDGDFHREQRKLLAPSFQPRHITAYADTMVAYGEQIQQCWADGMTIDIGQQMTNLTLSIVGKVLFDADVFSEADELGAAMMTILAFANYSLTQLFPFPMSWPVPRSIQARKAMALLDSRIQKMIKERRASHEDRNDLLSVLLNSRNEDGKGMSDEQIRDEAITLFIAGHESTANVLTWAWYLLAEHPAIYNRMTAEVDDVLQGRQPTYADLVNLPYTLQVLKETLRLYPPAFAIVRSPLHDTEIAGYPIHKWEHIMISIYAIHRREECFPDPETFDPERFTPENEKKLPRHAYMPFGAGSRICIGNHFALMEGHLLLATLAQRVRFDLIAGQHPLPDVSKTINIHPHKNIQMVVRQRQHLWLRS